MSLFCLAAAIVAVAAAAVLAVRAALGPFRIPHVDVVVNSPFRLETIFWFCVLGLILMRGNSAAVAKEDSNFPRAYLAAVLALVALAYARNLADPFLSDDYILLSAGPFRWTDLTAHLRSPGGDGSWRPLGYAYFAMMRAVDGFSPLKWHLQALVVHLANSALVFRIAWKLWQNTAAAFVAGAAFGLSGARPEAAYWISGGYEILAAFCVLAALSIALSDRIGANAKLLLVASLTALAIGCKETAYASPVLLAVLVWNRAQGRQLVAASIVVCAALFIWRWHVFGGPGGYADPATGHSMILSLPLATTAKALLARIWSVLLLPVNWDAPALWWLPVSLVACAAGLIVLLTCGSKTQIGLLAAVAAGVVPAIHLALIGQSALGSRILYLPGVAFALWLGSALAGAGQRGAMAAAVMLLGTAGILENNLGAWHDAAVTARALCQAGAAGVIVQPPGTFEGVYLLRNGFAECVAAARDRH